jgi:hypothetical protein
MYGREPILETGDDSQRVRAPSRFFTCGRNRPRQACFDLPRHALQFDVAWGKIERGTGQAQSGGEIAFATLKVGEGPERRQVLGRRHQNLLQFPPRLVDFADAHPGSRKRDARREVRGMNGESGPAHRDGLAKAARAPVLFRKLRKNNRRRVLANPAS